MTEHFSDAIAASRAVLVEAMRVLGGLRSHLVVIGGWVPELRLPGRGHPGSLDVDVAVDMRSLPPGPYATIRQRLVEAGYRQDTVPSAFVRDVAGVSSDFRVRLDLVGTPDAASGEAPSSRRAQELQIPVLRGIEIALDSCDEIRIEGERPDRVSDTVVARIATLESFICMKAFAMTERQKSKDAYDIYFCLRHGDIDSLSAAMSAMQGNAQVREAIVLLNDKFRTINHLGPVDAATVAEEHGQDFEQARRAAFELMRLLLERIAGY